MEVSAEQQKDRKEETHQEEQQCSVSVVKQLMDREPELLRMVLNCADQVSCGSWSVVCSMWYNMLRDHPMRGKPHQSTPPRRSYAGVLADHGQLELLKWVMKRGQFKGNKLLHVVHCAARSGQFAVLQWLWLVDARQFGGVCAAAAEGGHLEVLQWARANGCPWDESTCTNAAAGGHLKVLQWARTHGCPWDEHTCASAAWSGHLKVLQWAHANSCSWAH
eukprot:TRINITY_DN3655_c0_g2_i4.p2 TRINITY_DN3655_c0_g2~~TRINITY_DN3655_c0_g2_i4.p2  ORF type:complete len:220 (+),score=23.15 TRINITY_DN3655_c0_g2_i4:7-666(+)